MLLYVLVGQKPCIYMLDNIQKNHCTNIYKLKKVTTFQCQPCLIVCTVIISDNCVLEHQQLPRRNWKKHILEIRVSIETKCPLVSRPWSAQPCIHTLADSTSSLSLAATITSGPTGFAHPSTVQVCPGNGEICFNINIQLFPVLPCTCFWKQLSLNYRTAEYVSRATKPGGRNQTWPVLLKGWRSPLHTMASLSKELFPYQDVEASYIIQLQVILGIHSSFYSF